MDLLIIGFDGGDPKLLQQWVDEGRLPHFAEIMEDGVFRELRSTELPITPSAWTSFMTGKNPGKHGIFDFTKVTDDHELGIVSFADVDEPTVFELVEDHGVATLNVPATYPPRDIANGVMVSGMMTPSINQATTDADTVEMLREIEYEIEVQDTYDGSNEDAVIKKLEEMLDKRTEAAKKMIEEEDPDVFMPVYTAVDRASHWFWKHMDENHPAHDPGDEEYRDVVRRFYEKMDAAVGELLETVDEDTTVMVMSDHGFAGLEHGLNLNV